MGVLQSTSRVTGGKAWAECADGTLMNPSVSSEEARSPAQATAGALVERSGRMVDGEPEVLLRPVSLRVTGPGRKERAYQARIEVLEADAEAAACAHGEVSRELEVARLIERGTERLTDRLEAEAVRSKEQLERVQDQGKRLMVALGALQGENQVLRAELEAARSREHRLLARSPRPRKPLLARLLGR